MGVVVSLSYRGVCVSLHHTKEWSKKWKLHDMHPCTCGLVYSCAVHGSGTDVDKGRTLQGRGGVLYVETLLDRVVNGKSQS